MALDRLAVTIMVTDAERAHLDMGATAAGLSFPPIHPDAMRVASAANIPAQHP